MTSNSIRSPLGITRRRLGTGLAAIAAAAALPGALITPARAQAPLDPWKVLADISVDARKLGLAVPVVSSAGPGSGDYRDILPAAVDFIDKLGEAIAKSKLPAAQTAPLQQRASDLLRAVHKSEKAPRQKAGYDRPRNGVLSMLATPAYADDQARLAKFKQYHDSYLQLYDTCTVRSDDRAQVDWYMGKLTSDAYRARYEAVGNAMCVPWYFIGIVHALEASFDFNGHLHNGDPLSERTSDVPANRPPIWLPPSDWESSARDALEFEGFTNQLDWSLAHTLFRYEAYNGFRSREQHSINTPYLWSFSNHYSSGKFVSDGVWSSSAVSKQCGAGVLLHELEAKRLISFTA